VSDFYIKKIGKRGKIDIWLVDGFKIRRDVDGQFSNFGQHFRFSFIPQNEFWLDKESVPNERHFFVDHLLVEWKMMNDGVSYNEAVEVADNKERVERMMSGDFKKIVAKDGSIDTSKARKHLLGKTKEGVFVWLVDGRAVRSVFDIDFAEGGHDLVYNYVPQNEIWIDDDVSAKERLYVILHELCERSWIGKGLNYSQAHYEKASPLEWEVRHNPEKLEESLMILGYCPE